MSRAVDNETTCLDLPGRGPREGDLSSTPRSRSAASLTECSGSSSDDFGARGGFFGAFMRGRAYERMDTRVSDSAA
jgi:hypothetical protein